MKGRRAGRKKKKEGELSSYVSDGQYLDSFLSKWKFRVKPGHS